jgi:hypothetical protein
MDPKGPSKISGDEFEVTPETSAQNADTSCKTGPDKGGFSINLDRIQEVLPDEQVCIEFKGFVTKLKKLNCPHIWE